MAKLTIEATIPSGKTASVEEGLPLLLQMMQGAGFTNISVSTTMAIPETYEAPKPRMTAAQRRLQAEQTELKAALQELAEDVRWIKNEVIGSVDEENANV
jgi:hypothetical protein